MNEQSSVNERPSPAEYLRPLEVPLTPAEAERLLRWGLEQGIPVEDLGGVAAEALRHFLDGGASASWVAGLRSGMGPGVSASSDQGPEGRGGLAFPAARQLADLPAEEQRVAPVDEAARRKAFLTTASRALGYRVRDDSLADIFVPPPLAFALPRNPGDVLIGLTPDEGPVPGNIMPVQMLEPIAPRATPLSGLTNRLAPTFWASTRLVSMAGRDGAVRISDYLRDVMPRAWRNGAQLSAWEERRRAFLRAESGSKRRGLPYLASARWPTPSGGSGREASTATSFVRASIGVWSEVKRYADGPLLLFGLAEVLAPRDRDEHWCIRPTPHAFRVARALGDTHASCQYPHDDATWHVLRDCLADTPTHELRRATQALMAVRDSRETADFNERIVMLDGGGTGLVASSEAGGHLARLRELGLVEIGGRGFGEAAITPRGWDLLAEQGVA